MYEHDERIVMTLDAGGTNFVFSAMQGCREIIDYLLTGSIRQLGALPVCACRGISGSRKAITQTSGSHKFCFSRTR